MGGAKFQPFIFKALKGFRGIKNGQNYVEIYSNCKTFGRQFMKNSFFMLNFLHNIQTFHMLSFFAKNAMSKKFHVIQMQMKVKIGYL